MRHNFKTLSDLFEYASVRYAKRTASQFTDGSQAYTYTHFKETADNLSRILSNFGVSAFDKVAILSENMPHWGIAFFAITAYGRVAVPMLNELSSSEVSNILAHSEAKALFVSRRQLKKVSEEALSHLNLVIDIETFEFIKQDDAAFTCDGRVITPNPMDMAALIYTSGTTGSPKGVMLSHRNFCASVLDAWYAQHENKRSVFLSILPMAHTYEMTLGLLSDSYHTVYSGLSLIYGDTSMCDVALTEVKFAEISEKDIAKYVKSGEPRGKAGSYAIQGDAAAFVEKIDGDYYNVVGFPLALFCRMIKTMFGISIFELGEKK